MEDTELAAMVAECDIDHALPPSPMFPRTRAEVALRLQRLRDEVLPAYAGARNDPSRPEGASSLSPYLHFGIVGPREIVATVMTADVPAKTRDKFLDELLTWREWFHYKAGTLRVREGYGLVSTRTDGALRRRPKARLGSPPLRARPSGYPYRISPRSIRISRSRFRE
jgi:deoxyribodipyrimidine photo-lyase